MPQDPIVAEVHRTREQLLAQAGGDLERLMAILEAQEAQHPERLVVPKSAS